MKNDGGPAFPKFELDSGAGGCIGGMSLRDYFAAAALKALIIGASHNNNELVIHTDKGLLVRAMRQAGPELAYDYADAMLAEREKL